MEPARVIPPLNTTTGYSGQNYFESSLDSSESGDSPTFGTALPSSRPLLQQLGKKGLPKKKIDSYTEWSERPIPSQPVPEGRLGSSKVFLASTASSVSKQSRKEVMETLKKTVESTKAFAALLNTHSQNLYQRKAEIGNIRRDHESWKAALNTQYSEMVAIWAKAGLSYGLISCLKNPKNIASALANIIALETLIPQLTIKYEALSLVLGSSHHQQALQFYKKTKRKCRVIKNANVSVEEKVDRLATRFMKVKKKIEGVAPIFRKKTEAVVHQTALLYEELLKYIIFTARNFLPKAESKKAEPNHADGFLCEVEPLLAPPTEPQKGDQVDVLAASFAAVTIREDKVESLPAPTTKPQEGDQVVLLVADLEAVATSEDALLAPPQPPPVQSGGGGGWFSFNWMPNISGWIWKSPIQDVPKPPPAVITEAVALRINRLIGDVKALEAWLSPLTPRRKNVEKLSNEALDQVIAFKDSCHKLPLPQEDDFRNGQAFTITRLVGLYLEIKGQIEHLQDIGRALNSLESSIQNRLKTVCGLQAAVQDNKSVEVQIKEFETNIQGLTELIYLQQKSLEALPISNRIHAGWYYAARLLAKVNDVQLSLHQFKRLARESFAPYGLATNHLIEYLDPAYLHPHDANLAALSKSKDYLAGMLAIHRLFSSIQAARLLPDSHGTSGSSTDNLKRTINDAIGEIIARLGPRTLAETPDEARVASKVLLKTQPDEFFEQDEDRGLKLPKVIVHYLVKGFLRHTHFLKTKIDPEFDMVLVVLENDPIYKEYFDATVRQNENFNTHFQAYCSGSDIVTYEPQINLLLTALFTLSSNPRASQIEVLFQYCKARQIMSDLHSLSATVLVSSQQALRLEWIEKKANAVFTDREFLLPGYFSELETLDVSGLQQMLENPSVENDIALRIQQNSQIRRVLSTETLARIQALAKEEVSVMRAKVLYKLICISLYCSDPQSKMQATKHLVGWLDSLEADALPRPEDSVGNIHLVRLLQGWVLEQYMSEANLQTKHTEVILTTLFKEYLNNVDRSTRDLWRSFSDIGLMEVALNKLLMSQEVKHGGLNGIYINLIDFRGTAYRTLWKRVLIHYGAFIQLLDKHKFFNLTTNELAYLEAQQYIQDVLREFQGVPADDREETDTHLGIAQWCCQDMRMKFQINSYSVTSWAVK